MTAEPTPAESAAAELAWLKAEVAALGPEPDAAALAAFEARLERRFQASRAENNRRLAEFERDHPATSTKIETPPTPVLRGGRAVAVLGLMAWMTGGLLLEASIGNVFFFNHGDVHSAVAPWVFLALLLPLGWGLGHMLRRFMPERYPTWAVRWLLFFPFVVAAIAGMIVAAPLGWAALAGWALGTPVEVEARVVSVGTRSRSALACKQKGRLRIADKEGNVCLSMLVADDRMPAPGDDVRVSGRSSGLGLFAREMRRR
jgi:hypothetical protein